MNWVELKPNGLKLSRDEWDDTIPGWVAAVLHSHAAIEFTYLEIRAQATYMLTHDNRIEFRVGLCNKTFHHGIGFCCSLILWIVKKNSVALACMDSGGENCYKRHYLHPRHRVCAKGLYPHNCYSAKILLLSYVESRQVFEKQQVCGAKWWRLYEK